RRRKKKRSKQFRDEFGHTLLSNEEKIPWKCRRLVIGTGTGGLPVMREVKREAQRRKTKLLILPTKEAIKELRHKGEETNAVLQSRAKAGNSQSITLCRQASQKTSDRSSAIVQT